MDRYERGATTRRPRGWQVAPILMALLTGTAACGGEPAEEPAPPASEAEPATPPAGATQEATPLTTTPSEPMDTTPSGTPAVPATAADSVP